MIQDCRLFQQFKLGGSDLVIFGVGARRIVPSAYLCVSREKRFLPVKTREDLERLAPAIERLIAALPLQSSVVPAKPL